MDAKRLVPLEAGFIKNPPFHFLTISPPDPGHCGKQKNKGYLGVMDPEELAMQLKKEVSLGLAKIPRDFRAMREDVTYRLQDDCP